MGYWRAIKKIFERNGNKKAAAEACKSFDDSKEGINKEFEEKKTELQPKVIEVYEASSAEIKTLITERTEAEIQKNATAVQTFLEELVKIEFPGSKQVSEASTKYGPVMVFGPVLFVLEKVSTFVVTEEKPAAETTTEKTTETETTIKTEETSGKDKEIATEETSGKDKEIATEETSGKDKEIAIEEVKVAETVAPAEKTETTEKTVTTEKTETTEAAPVSSEPPKAEEVETPKP